MLSEKDGVKVLTEAFKARGYSIKNNSKFAEGGVEFVVDGWDSASRVGFEYRTHEADDRRDLTDEEIGQLGARIERGELFLLIVDDMRVPDAATLRGHADRFLDEIGQRIQPKKTQAKAKATKTQKRGR